MSIITQPEALSAHEILELNPQSPERLFPRDADAIKGLFRRLMKQWHPDLNKDPRASEVVQHLCTLKEQAEEKLSQGTWQEPGFYSCRLSDGRLFRVSSDAERKIDVGSMHIAQRTVTFVIPKTHAALVENAVSAIQKLSFADEKMRAVYAQGLPIDFRRFESEDALILTVRKRPEDLLLRDALPGIRRENLDRHAAWIIGRMIDMVRYLDYCGLVHGALSVDTLFLSPSGHALGLLGGWWYAHEAGAPLTVATEEALDFLPDDTRSLRAEPKLDLEMIRAVGREILGDRGGTRLPQMKVAPEPLVTFLRMPPSGNAQTDLEVWNGSVLPKSFGARRFIDLKLPYSDIYPSGGPS